VSCVAGHGCADKGSCREISEADSPVVILDDISIPLKPKQTSPPEDMSAATNGDAKLSAQVDRGKRKREVADDDDIVMDGQPAKKGRTDDANTAATKSIVVEDSGDGTILIDDN